MHRLLIVFITSLLSLTAISAQEIMANLDFYGDIMINAVDGKHRTRAAEQFDKYFQQALESKKIEELKNLRWVSHIAPDDGSFDMFSWQLKESKSEHSHKAYVITNEQKIIALSDTDHEEIDYPYMELSNDDWSGLLYYDILTLTIEGEEVHLLFGLDGSDEFSSIRVVESIEIQGENVLFGSKPVFEYPQSGVRSDVKNRLFLKYSEFSNLTIGYNEGMKMLLFDHLIPRMGTVPGQGPTKISDGSYEAFVYEEGKLVYKDKVFNQISQEAPTPAPILGKGRSSTITGETKEVKKSRN